MSSPTVGSIHIESTNVFDPSVPGEDWWLFRVANVIHIPTRAPVLRREVLMKPGERWDRLAAIQTERNLRALPYIKRAEVEPRPGPGGLLDLWVRTQDTWTTNLETSAGTEGGERFFIAGAEEKNLLGLGNSLSFHHAEIGPDRKNEVRYADPRFLGSWVSLTSLYAFTDKGDETGVLTERPFFELETPYSAAAGWVRTIQEERLYQSGDAFSRFRRSFRSVQGSYGIRLNRHPTFVQRASLGYVYEKHRFDSQPETAAGTLPADRELSGPVLGYSWTQAKFLKETLINKMERVEDFNLGQELTVSAGWSAESLSSDRDRVILSALDQQGLSLGEGRFLLAQAGLQGRLAASKPENAILFGNINLFWKTRWLIPQTWVAHCEAAAARSLDGEKQVILGGNSGLRGYRNNSFTGSKSLLLNLEDRIFYEPEILHLFHLGGVLFLDTGAVLPESGAFRFNQFKSDIGIGLRFAPSRSTRGTAARVDLAYALNPEAGAGRWVVSIRAGQAFDVFNSSLRGVLRGPISRVGEESPGTRLRRQ